MLDHASRRRAALVAVIAVAACSTALLSSRARADPNESQRLAEALGLREGVSVADVGGGRGKWTEELARRVGATGHVYATEVKQDKVDDIAKRAERAGLQNVTAILGNQDDTGLPTGCCDAILLRLVYHHFQDPPKMRASLATAMKPGARLVIVDTAPHGDWRELPGVPDRGGHGISPKDLVSEMTRDGFELIEQHHDWPDEEANYCAVFRLRSRTAQEGGVP